MAWDKEVAGEGLVGGMFGGRKLTDWVAEVGRGKLLNGTGGKGAVKQRWAMEGMCSRDSHYLVGASRAGKGRQGVQGARQGVGT